MRAKQPPLYYRVKESLLDEIMQGGYPPGSRFLTEREVCSRFGVSTTTAVRALNELVRDGQLVRRQGSGTFIADQRQRTSAPEANRNDGDTSRAIGCIFAHLGGKHVLETIRGIEAACREANLHMLVFDSAGSREIEEDNIRRALSANALGLVVLPVDSYDNTSILRELEQQDTPLVLIDRYYPSVPTDTIVPHNFSIGFELTTYLIRQGHRHIATLWAETSCTSVQDRLAGYKEALVRHDLPIVPDLAMLAPYESLAPEARQTLLTSWIESSKRPSAFLAVNGNVLSRLATDLLNLGVDFLNEVDLGSMDDSVPHDILSLAAVTAVLPSYEMGNAAVRLLLKRVSKPRDPKDHEHVVLPAKVVVRKHSPVHLGSATINVADRRIGTDSAQNELPAS